MKIFTSSTSILREKSFNKLVSALGMLLLLTVSSFTFGQNAIVGTGFSTGWGVNNCSTAGGTNFKYLSLITGTSGTGTYGVTTVANSTGNQYMRFGKDWSSTYAQYAITPGIDTQITPNTQYSLNTTCTNSGSQYVNVGSTSYNYIFKTLNAGTAPTGTFVMFEVQGAVQTITSVTASPSAVPINMPVTITANLSGALSTGQDVYLRYTNDAWSTSTVVKMTSSTATAYLSTIPGQTSGKVVSYYTFTSGTSGVLSNGSNADLFTINWNAGSVNGGSNYSYTTGTTAQNVWVTSTGGTGSAGAAYTTLAAAFTAINAGTHTGAITVTILANTTEPATIVSLLKSGAPSSYTSISIKPSGNRTITASTVTANNAVINLLGADNVTIDGDDPSTSGTQNLTVTMPTAASTALSVINLSSNSTTGTDGCNNVTIKNCILIGSRSSATNTQANYGIALCNASTPATGAYSSINTIIQNNNITRCWNGINANGTSATYPNTGLEILNNTIGTPTSGTFADATSVGNRGILLSYTATTTGGAIVRGNDIRVGVTATGYNNSIAGIEIGTGNYGVIIDRNNIHDIVQPVTGGYGAFGIYVTATTNNTLSTISNNIIRNVKMVAYQTASASAFIPSGIYFSAGATGVNFVNNTIAMGTQLATGNWSSFCVNASVNGVRFTKFLNNILVNTHTSTYAFGLYTNANANISSATMNNNNYYVPNTGQIGYYNAANRSNLSAWQTATSKDANSYSVNPSFVSTTDLHLNTSGNTALESTGATTATSGITIDYDNQTRPGPTGSVNGGGTAPDIGADEFDGVPATPCAVPNVPTALTYNTVTTTSLNGSFTAPSPIPTSYIVIRSTSSTLSAGPVDGTTYTAGSSTIGGGNVVALPSTTTFSDSGLTASTLYYYFVYAVNSGTCTGGPKYSTTNITNNQVTVCAAATALAESTLTSTSATLTWTGAGNYIVEYGAAGFTPGTGATAGVGGTIATSTATTPYVLSGLTSTTTYDVYVRQVCAVGGFYSANSTKDTFTTLQIPATLPYTQNFTATNDFSFINGAQTNKWVYGTATGNTANSLYISNDNGVTNAYTLTSASVVQTYKDIAIPIGTTLTSLSFDWKANGESTFDYLRVWLVPTSFTPTAGAQITAGSGRIQVGGNFGLVSTWQTYSNPILDLSTFANTTMRLVFEWRNDTSQGNQTPAAIDNISLSIPACGVPTIAATNNIVETTATINWTAPASAPSNGYNYEVRTSGTAGSGATGLTTSGAVGTGIVTENITSLTPATTYSVYVQSNCGGSETSLWSIAGTFTTACTVPNNPGTISVTAPSATGFTLNYAAASPAPTNYILFNSTGTVATAIPTLVTGTTYTNGTAYTFGGNSYNCISNTSASPQVLTGGTSNTQYNYFLYSKSTTNSCFGNPYYSTGISVSTITCPATPTLPLASLVTDTSATVSWTASVVGGGAATINYTLEVYTDASYTTPISGSPFSMGTSVSQALTGLSAASTYYYRVKANNGSCDSTYLTGSLTTACGAITSFPNVETFVNYLPSACWEEGDLGNLTTGPATIGASTISDWVVDGFLNSGNTGAAKMNIDTATGSEWIISPYYTIPATGYRVKYSVGATQFGATTALTTAWESDDFVELLVSTSNTNWTVLKTYNSANVPSYLGQTDDVDLSAYNGQTVQFAFRAFEGVANGSADIDFFIDNFTVEQTPSCLPTTMNATTAITSTTATINWTASVSDPSNGYNYEVRTSGTAGSGAAGLTTSGAIGAGIVTATVTGLTAATTYSVYVQSNCGGSEISSWSTAGTFTTACTVPNNPGTISVTAPSATGVTLNYAVASPAPTNYILFSSTGTVATAIPTLVTGTTYTNGTAYTFGGDSYNCISNTSTSPQALTGLTSNTQYNYFLYSKSTTNNCFGNPYYSTGISVSTITCPAAPTLPVVSLVTDSSATVSWTASVIGGDAGAINYTLEVYTDAGYTTPISGSPFSMGTSVSQALTGLSAASTYYYRVKANNGSCDSSYLTGTVTTLCNGITSLPWTEGFEGVTIGTTVAGTATNLPNCWNSGSTQWSSSNVTTYNTAKTGSNYIRYAWLTTNAFIWTPGFQLTAGVSYDFSFNAQGDGFTTWVNDIFVNSSQSSTGATQLGASYSPTGPGSQVIQGYNKLTRTFVPSSTGVYYFAIRGNQADSSPWYMAFDDFKLEVTPSPITITPSAPAICIGDSVSLTASSTAGYTYTWTPTTGLSANTGATVIASPTTTTTYTVTGVSGTISTTQTVTVTVNPAPSAVTITPSATTCPNVVTTLTASSAGVGTYTVGTSNGNSVAANTPYRQNTSAANQSRVQYLISKTELNAAGINSATNLTSLGFNVTTAGTGTISNYTISMTNTNLTVLNATYQTPTFTTVFTGTNILPVSGINTHTFSSPFAWDGTSNILINICHQGAGGTASAVSIATPTNVSTTSGGGNNQCNLTTGGATNANRPVMTFGVGSLITWTPTTDLYTDSGATTAYTGTVAGTVYAKPTATTTYTATATLGSCTKTNTTTITTKIPVGITSVTADASPICSTATTSLTANDVVGTNAVVTWWTGSGGTGTNLGTGLTLSNVGPGTYYARVTGDCGTPAEASITVGTKVTIGITSITAVSNSVCSTETTTLTANGIVGDGAVVTWYTVSGGIGTSLGTGATLTGGPGTYYAYVTGDCGSPVEASITIGTKVNVGISNVSADANPICATATTTLTANGVVGTNAVVTWWTGSGGTGTNLGTGLTISVGPGNYYARVTGDCGTPQEANYFINTTAVPTYVNLQFPGSGSTCQGGTFTSYGQVYQAGITEAAGAGSGITAQFGYSTSNTDPSTWTDWSNATFNVQSGNNDEYTYTFSPPTSGTYYYTYRYRQGTCDWLYGSYWNGTSNVNGELTVNPTLTASVSVTASETTICGGTSVTFTATPTNGGTAPSYQWYVGATQVGTNSDTFTSSTLTNGNSVSVVMTSNATPCLAGSPATSSAITMTVNPTLTASVSIAASATTICPGTSAIFTATPTNGGAAPSYQWYVGTTTVGSNSDTFTTSSLTNGDTVSVVMTSNATPCLAGSPATSSEITMTVSNNISWTGAVSNLWSDGANWSCGSVPLDTSIITISSGTPNLDEDFTVANSGSLTLNGTASLIINSNASLTIEGTADFNDRPVTFKSDNNGTAAFGTLTGILNGATNVTTERHFKNRRAFRFTSSSVTTSSSIKANWQEGVNNTNTTFANNQNPNPGYGTHITGTGGSTNGFDTTISNVSSLFTYNNSTSTWTAVSNTNSNTLNAGVPYRINIRGDRSIDLSITNPPATHTTLRATGTLYTGPYNPGGLNANAYAYNLVGNPYQAPVNMKSVLDNATNLNNAIYYVWEPRMGQRGAYISVDLNTNTPNNITSASNKFLQPGQACFVRTASTGGAPIMNFQESYKDLTASNGLVFKNTNQSITATSNIKMRLYDSNSLALNQTALDGSIIFFDDLYNNGVDQNDGAKFTNPDEMFSTFNNGALISIEKRMQPTSTDIIPIRISQYRGTNYTIVAQGENLNGIPAYLHDQFLQTYTEIPQSGAVNYPYTVVTTNTQTTATDRFRIVYSNPLLSTANNEWKNFTLYPNPSKQGDFNIILGQPLDNGKITIYNTLGVKVYSQDLENTIENSINPKQSMPTGVYYVEIQNGSERSIKKLIIE